MDDASERERVHERLDDLERCIADTRRKLGEFGSLGENLDQQWDRIVTGHAALRNRLDAHRAPGTPAALHTDLGRLERDLEDWGIALEELIAGRARGQG